MTYEEKWEFDYIKRKIKENTNNLQILNLLDLIEILEKEINKITKEK